MDVEYRAIMDQNLDMLIKAAVTYLKSMEQAMFANMDLRAVPIKRAAEMLGRSPGTIRKMAAEGKLDRVDNFITVASIYRYLHAGGRTGHSRSGYMRIL